MGSACAATPLALRRHPATPVAAGVVPALIYEPRPAVILRLLGLVPRPVVTVLDRRLEAYLAKYGRVISGNATL